MKFVNKYLAKNYLNAIGEQTFLVRVDSPNAIKYN